MPSFRTPPILTCSPPGFLAWVFPMRHSNKMNICLWNSKWQLFSCRSENVKIAPTSTKYLNQLNHIQQKTVIPTSKSKTLGSLLCIIYFDFLVLYLFTPSGVWWKGKVTEIVNAWIDYSYVHCTQVNTSPSSAAFMRQWIGSALVQIMACR